MLDGVITDVVITLLTFFCFVNILRGVKNALDHSTKPFYLTPAHTHQPTTTARCTTIARTAASPVFAAALSSSERTRWKGLAKC